MMDEERVTRELLMTHLRRRLFNLKMKDEELVRWSSDYNSLIPTNGDGGDTIIRVPEMNLYCVIRRSADLRSKKGGGYGNE